MSSEITNRPCPWNGAVAKAIEIVKAGERQKAFLRNIMDSEYWVCCCFRDRVQRDEFLSQVGGTGKYIDGERLMERLKS